MSSYECAGPEPTDCRDAADLLAKLDPSAGFWAPFEVGRWAFRGQADGSWDLVPRALRTGAPLSFANPALRAPLERRLQLEAEWHLLAEFVELADELGFRLPGDLSAFRFPWIQHESTIVMNQSWPPTNVLEVAAIAQHHGVPTRLLDFSLNPFVAAFFAASQQTSSEHLAVWAVDLQFIRMAWAAFNPGVRVVQVSRGLNPFLHAQSGLFMYDAGNSSNSIRQTILEHDLELTTHIDSRTKAHLAKSPRVRCFRVPAGHREAVLEQLAARRITQAHLQPTLDNVVKQLWSNATAPT